MDSAVGRNSLTLILILAGIFPILFIIVFFFFPVTSIALYGLSDEDGHFTMARIVSLLSSPYYGRIIGFTLFQALISTIFSVGMGLPGAYILSHFDFPGKSIFKSITMIPFVLPSILVVLGFVLLFGNNGIINRLLMSLFHTTEPPLQILYSFKAIILAHVFYNFPVCTRVVSSVWEHIPPSLSQAARSLGASRLRIFFTVTLPQIFSGIMASASLIFLFCFMSFAIILVLGGGPRYTTLEVEVYRLSKFTLNLETGSALAVIQSLISLVCIYGYGRLQKKAALAENIQILKRQPGIKELFHRSASFFLIMYLCAIVLIIILPLLSVIQHSFLARFGWSGNTRISLRWYKEILFPASFSAQSTFLFAAVKNSLFFAFGTLLLAVPFGTIFAYLTLHCKHNQPGRAITFFESLLMLPMGISSIMLALGYIRLQQLLPSASLNSRLLILCAHTIIAYPFTIRATAAVLKGIPQSVFEAAASLGAGRARSFFTIDVPLVRSGLLISAAFAFAISIGEINATLMLSPPGLSTIPIAMYRMIASYNFFGACALGTILIVLCGIVFLVIDRLGKDFIEGD
ncbi:MAG: iron ABC transporter permease [Spirochaetota bacterium]